MNKLEKATMKKWTGKKKEISEDTVESLLNDPDIVPLEAPLNANVWKIKFEEGDEIKMDQVISILEPMKLEVAVKAEKSMVGGKVKKALVRPGDVFSAGKAMLLVRPNE